MHEAYRSATNALEELAVWSRPFGEAVFRVACFLEDQVHTSNDLIETTHAESGALIFADLIADVYPTIVGGANASLASSLEENGENLQLITSYLMDKHKGIPLFDGTAVPSPYNDDELWQLMLLASIWRHYDTLWERITYFGWQLAPVTADDGAAGLFYMPSDSENLAACRRDKAVREFTVQGQAVSPFV